MISGELIVMGSNQAQIELSGTPVRINVSFSDGGDIIVPCNPHYNDSLTWHINGNILTVNWQVSGIRAITWNAWFYWAELT
jgi:hypothetical protein